ncbi:MAG: hydantoinase/oxoprolinase family protein [Betaproteobacteria bacterium]|nr:hydantoinase/oxoprolinase family protein [Betaproteobacteria bacterium]
MGKLINIDNGGTLTDIVVIDGNRIFHTKTLTTPYDLSKCFISGLKQAASAIYGEENLAALLQSTDHIRYSTTQGTNALVEKKGPRLGLIVDAGTNIASLKATGKEREMLEALIGSRIAEIRHELQGEEYTRALVDAVNRLSAAGAQRIVVSFSGADHVDLELRCMREVNRTFPRHLLGAVPFLYTGLLTEDREYGRRTWTAVMNAFLHPSMEQFLFYAENLLRPYGMRNPLLIYRNDGYSGCVAKTTALKTYSSGPRAGMESSRAIAARHGLHRLVSVDVGGTTTDLGLVENGSIRSLPYGHIEGVECSLPLCDIVSIGVAGGSIFRVKEGKICVGPDSVGGAPGPACFGMGGQQATITDALLLMGLIDPATYFGGSMKLDAERAGAAVLQDVATPLGLTLAQAVHVMLAAWAEEIAKSISAYVKVDQDTALMGFGGGGPLAILAIAEAVKVDTVVVPRLAAVFSAYGIGFSDIGHQAESRLETTDVLADCIGKLMDRVQRDMFAEGFEIHECRFEGWITAGAQRYPVDLDKPALPHGLPARETMTLSVRAVRVLPHAALDRDDALKKVPAVVAGVRRLLLPDGKTAELPVIRVEDQPAGAAGVGPAVMEEAYWTCHVRENWRYEFTASGCIVFRRSN